MTDGSATSGARAFSFGPFRLLPAQQLLLEGETPVRLGGRALEVLAALVERAGELVSKSELMARAWPDVVVEENNLKVHVAALRRALGEGQPGRRFVATVSGRGYRFVAPVERAQPATPPVQRSAPADPTHNLPASSTRTIGRAATIDTLLRQLPQHRLVTAVGPGGIGKTTVALAVAEALIAAYQHGVRFVDLASLSDPQRAPSAVASALGLTIHSENEVAALLAYLRDRQMLIVLDSCEHVIEAAASLAEQIISFAPGVHILATSREPLRARAERVHRLAPLGSPSGSNGLTAAEALAFPAVQLFVERAAESLDGFELGDADAPVVADICHKLEGIALAIELAATRIDTFGIRELSALLDDRFRLLKQGRRTVLARHRTLAATLDWSYEFLPESERIVLRRLSVFAGAFTLDSACAVAGDSAIAVRDVIDGVANLVAKSLVSADVSGAVVQYRLLETTRAYALQKLGESEAPDAVVRRHAEHHRDLLARAAAESGARPMADWLAVYGRRIDDVRSALNWAFSAGGDLPTGVALTVAAIPLWMHLSLWDECRACIERALASDRSETWYGDRDEMKLQTALGAAMLHTRGPRPEIGIAWTRTLEIAEHINDSEHQLRALWGLSTYHRTRGAHRRALAFAERCRAAAAAKGDAAARLAADRLVATALHHLGDYGSARRLADRFLSQYAHPARGGHDARFPYDQRVGALGTLSAILWLQGFPDQAARMAQRTLEEARAKVSGLMLCDVLLHAPLPVALHVGDWMAAERLLVIVRENLTNHALGVCHAKALCLRGMLDIQRGDVAGLPLLRRALDELRESQFGLRYPAYLGTLAQGLDADGQAAEARAVIEEALELSRRKEEVWCLPELLRIKGELLQSEDQCQEALDLARRQGALSWELRAAMSLARLWHQRGRTGEADELLSSVYDRFTEGFETGDLRTARALIDAFRAAPA